MTINEMFTVALGGENLFDEYPDDEQDGTRASSVWRTRQHCLMDSMAGFTTCA